MRARPTVPPTTSRASTVATVSLRNCRRSANVTSPAGARVGVAAAPGGPWGPGGPGEPGRPVTGVLAWASLADALSAGPGAGGVPDWGTRVTVAGPPPDGVSRVVGPAASTEGGVPEVSTVT